MNELRSLIKLKYGTVRRFSEKIGYTEGMLSKMLHGKRKIYPYMQDLMAGYLDIPKTEYKKYFGEVA